MTRMKTGHWICVGLGAVGIYWLYSTGRLGDWLHRADMRTEVADTDPWQGFIPGG